MKIGITAIISLTVTMIMVMISGIDLSKNWVGKPKYWGKKVVKSDECMGVSQLLGAHVPRLPPQSLRLWS